MISLLLAATLSFQAFAFLEGDWCGNGIGADVVERWDAPVGGAMTGTMTAVKQGAVWFHEFMVIQAEDDGWVLRLKHFEPSLVSWEEKQEVVIFPLQSTTDGVAEFDGLRFERPAPDTLRVVVVQENPVIFEYERCD